MGAAHQDIAIGWHVDRVRSIADRAADKRSFACVANPRAAGPTHWDVACFRKLEEALEFGRPADIESASRKRNHRSRA